MDLYDKKIERQRKKLLQIINSIIYNFPFDEKYTDAEEYLLITLPTADILLEDYNGSYFHSLQNSFETVLSEEKLQCFLFGYQLAKKSTFGFFDSEEYSKLIKECTKYTKEEDV